MYSSYSSVTNSLGPISTRAAHPTLSPHVPPLLTVSNDTYANRHVNMLYVYIVCSVDLGAYLTAPAINEDASDDEYGAIQFTAKSSYDEMGWCSTCV